MAQAGVKLLVATELAERCDMVRLDLGKFLGIFRYLRPEVELTNGLRLSRGLFRLSE